MLDIHPKTIQRYIREGKLRANKIGKGWRVSGQDLNAFTEGTEKKAPSDERSADDRVKISSVIDIDVDEMDDAIAMVNMLTAVLNTKPPEYGRSTMSAQFLESERKVRIMLWGNLPFMETMLGFISEMSTRVK